MNSALLTDFYKISHPFQYPKGTEFVNSNLTARKSRINGVDDVVFFGLQYFIKEYLIDHFNKNFFQVPKEEILAEYKRVCKFTVGELPSYDHISDLHDLGYLPLEIKAAPEGSKVPIGVPMLTIMNTDARFFWLTNFVESLMSAIIWQPITSATKADQYKQLFSKVLKETVGDDGFAAFMGHDFSFRGMSGLESAYMSGMGHLLSFVGTDTVPAIMAMEKYYNADIEKELVGCSVPATEHSVMSSGTGVHGEFETFKMLVTEMYPSGIISIVSDTFDLWEVMTDFLPRLKDDIMARSGADINKVVIRPDSGDPVDIICGKNIKDYTNKLKDITDLDTIQWFVHEDVEEKVRQETAHGESGDWEVETIFKKDGKYYKLVSEFEWNRYDKQYYYIDESKPKSIEEIEATPEMKGVVELLWDTFGGTEVNGYKVLDDHVGAIYGDSITLERAQDISRRLMDKGFAPLIVYGIGSYTYQYNTRDTFGMAVKATAIVHEGKDIEIFKDPVTDDGTKKSLKGFLKVQNVDGKYVVTDQVSREEELETVYPTVFKDGSLLVDDSLADIRKRLGDTNA